MSGSVNISRRSGSESQQLACLGKGEMFGELALINPSPRMATAAAAEEGTRIVAVDQARFVYLVSQQPAFALSVMKVITERLQSSQARRTAR